MSEPQPVHKKHHHKHHHAQAKDIDDLDEVAEDRKKKE